MAHYARSQREILAQGPRARPDVGACGWDVWEALGVDGRDGRCSWLLESVGEALETALGFSFTMFEVRGGGVYSNSLA